MADKVRVDKWLWAVRIWKSRSLATEKCKSGKVSVNDVKVKPSQLIAPGDTVQVKKNGINYTYKVVRLLEKRVSASIAQECYEDLTPESELKKHDDWFVGKARPEKREPGAGRPTKKERRELEDFKRRLKP